MSRLRGSSIEGIVSWTLGLGGYDAWDDEEADASS